MSEIERTGMDLKRSLFYGNLVCLAPIDADKDAEIESRWSHDAQYLRMLQLETARPLSPAQVKKAYEKIEKSVEEDKDLFYFTIRTPSEQRLVGFARIYKVSWSHSTALLQLAVGDASDRRRGYGTEALGLLLRYAFDELNLVRLAALVSEYNTPALHFFEKAGFTVEVRRRQALERDGRRWDLLGLGLLQSEWARGGKSEADARGGA